MSGINPTVTSSEGGPTPGQRWTPDEMAYMSLMCAFEVGAGTKVAKTVIDDYEAVHGEGSLSDDTRTLVERAAIRGIQLYRPKWSELTEDERTQNMSRTTSNILAHLGFVDVDDDEMKSDVNN